MSQIEIRSGVFLDLLDPDPTLIELEDIALALSNLCRLTGHTKRFYSVAEHSLIVSELVPEDKALEGLLHDATEAFIGDVSAPLKKLLPEYKRIEVNLYKIIAKKFGIPQQLSAEVLEVDLRLCMTEKVHLIGPEGLDNPAWLPLSSKYKPYNWSCFPLRATNPEIRREFLRRFEELSS